VLGIGGVRMLRTLGYESVHRFHMNEGHAGLLGCELLREHLSEHNGGEVTDDAIEAIRESCVFTTHTPVPAGHDQFPIDAVRGVLGKRFTDMLHHLDCVDGSLNMTELALLLSRYVNGVARRHGEISRKLFHDDAIDSITNGVHVRTWAAPPFQRLFDQHIPTWREDSFSLRNALSIPNHEVWAAHRRAKDHLIDQVNRRSGMEFDPEVFTIGFARRATPYKRPDLLFHDLDCLRRIHREVGPFQIVYAGKAHPNDGGGKDMIRRIFAAKAQLQDQIRVAYLPDYGIRICQMMVAGADLWLNTPEPPLEASGTSGMKAAINGVPSLSVLDGWWLEGWIEGTTGWAIGRVSERLDRARDAGALYDKLEYIILPLYYRQRDNFVDVMRHCIALNGSFFNTDRMMHQYVVKAYFD
jgi:starch phosphorylase